MNAHIRTSRAGEGYDRKAWTVAEIDAMYAAGLIDTKWPYELSYASIVEVGPEAVLALPFKPALTFNLRQFC